MPTHDEHATRLVAWMRGRKPSWRQVEVRLLHHDDRIEIGVRPHLRRRPGAAGDGYRRLDCVMIDDVVPVDRHRISFDRVNSRVAFSSGGFAAVTGVYGHNDASYCVCFPALIVAAERTGVTLLVESG